MSWNYLVKAHQKCTMILDRKTPGFRFWLLWVCDIGNLLHIPVLSSVLWMNVVPIMCHCCIVEGENGGKVFSILGIWKYSVAAVVVMMVVVDVVVVELEQRRNLYSNMDTDPESQNTHFLYFHSIEDWVFDGFMLFKPPLQLTWCSVLPVPTERERASRGWILSPPFTEQNSWCWCQYLLVPSETETQALLLTS